VGRTSEGTEGIDPTEWDVQDSSEPRTLRGFLRRRGWRGPIGPSQCAIRDVLRKFTRKGRTSFTLVEVLDEADLDFDSFSDRVMAQAFLKRMREVVVETADWFRDQPEYQKYRDNGFSDKTVFRKLVEALVSYDVYPIQYNREIKEYTFMTLEGWVRIVKMRAIAIRNEFVRHAEDMAFMTRRFKAIKEMVTPPQLPTDGRFIKLPGPRHYRCGKCGIAFIDQESLDAHIDRRHSSEEDKSLRGGST